MAFPDHAACPALLNQLPVTFEGGFGPGLEVLQLNEQIRIVDQRTNLVKVLLHGSKHCLWRSKRLVVVYCRQLVVEGGDLASQIGQQFRGQFSLFLLVVKKLVLSELAHLDDVFESLSLAAQGRSFRSPGDGDHLQVQFFGEPSIQSQFLLAEMFPASEGGEVQEAEIHRFFDLVGIITGQDYL